MSIKEYMKYIKCSVFLTLAVLPFVLHSCYVENKLAREFANSMPQTHILILEPDLVLLSDIRPNGSDSLNSINNTLNRTDIAQLFMVTLQEELKTYNIKILTSSRLDTFFTLPPPAYLFNIAQLEVEQFNYPFKETYRTDSTIYTQEMLLNALNFNTWFEYSTLNSSKAPQILFSNFYIKDNIEGDFKTNILNDNVTYVYKRNDISTEDINTLTIYAAKTNASYIYNYLLNEYIKEKLGLTENGKYFFFYDRTKGKVLFLENYSEFKLIQEK